MRKKLTKVSRKERRKRERDLVKQLKKGKITPPDLTPEENLEENTTADVMKSEAKELQEERERKDLAKFLEGFVKATEINDTTKDVQEAPGIVVECIEKGAIHIQFLKNTKDPRCSNTECIICRSYDSTTGIVDRHLLSEKEKHARDMEALEEQKKRDPEGYKEFLRNEEIDSVDFEDVEPDTEED